MIAHVWEIMCILSQHMGLHDGSKSDWFVHFREIRYQCKLLICKCIRKQYFWDFKLLRFQNVFSFYIETIEMPFVSFGKQNFVSTYGLFLNWKHWISVQIYLSLEVTREYIMDLRFLPTRGVAKNQYVSVEHFVFNEMAFFDREKKNHCKFSVQQFSWFIFQIKYYDLINMMYISQLIRNVVLLRKMKLWREWLSLIVSRCRLMWFHPHQHNHTDLHWLSIWSIFFKQFWHMGVSKYHDFQSICVYFHVYVYIYIHRCNSYNFLTCVLKMSSLNEIILENVWKF